MESSPPRETELEAGGFVKGLAVALVIDNKDPDKLCRVKVRYPWHNKPTQSYWARLAQPMAGKGRGLVLIPEVDDEVVVGFEREDLRFPYVLGSLWNGQDKPPRSNDNGKNDVRVLKSRKSHQLLFDDGPKGVAELAHEKGRKIVFDDDGIRIQDEKGNVIKIDSASGAMTIEAKGALHLKGSSITLQSTGTIKINGATLILDGQQINIG